MTEQIIVSADSYFNQAAQFAEANRQEQTWLRDEIQGLKRLVWMLAKSAGGEIRIPRADFLACPKNADFQAFEDDIQRVIIVQALDQTQ